MYIYRLKIAQLQTMHDECSRPSAACAFLVTETFNRPKCNTFVACMAYINAGLIQSIKQVTRRGQFEIVVQ